MDIEEGIATFNINLVGKPDRQTYLGTFKVYCILTPMQFIDSDKTYREMIGDVHPENAHEHTTAISFALAQLKYRVIECPPFWQHPKMPGGHLRGADNIIMEIFNMAINAEQTYRKSQEKEQKEIEDKLAKAMNSGKIEKEEEEIEKVPLTQDGQPEEIDLDGKTDNRPEPKEE